MCFTAVLFTSMICGWHNTAYGPENSGVRCKLARFCGCRMALHNRDAARRTGALLDSRRAREWRRGRCNTSAGLLSLVCRARERRGDSEVLLLRVATV
ncbi:hypothetical protein BOTBODRAFT_455281 [Botryobasidium botryosum FD-172 SS1]|uniref:Secreted protein n=1 Tax=Botryobasidium botryosum (strain FD-172 SS1) TaxID=930990 RepID=A0A067MIQ2_BOTB1|nr:hypothetical protein BOTBODRAFT_455281 [Botryobasidium botryosum FD-172 SS1]